jgi:hypothetical protein
MFDTRHLLISAALAWPLGGVAHAQDPLPNNRGSQSAQQREHYTAIERDLNRRAEQIVDPAERSLALEHAASTLINSQRLLRYQADPAEDDIQARYRDIYSERDPEMRARREREKDQALEELRNNRFQETLPRYDQALSALQNAEKAALLVRDGTLHDVRLISVSRTALTMVKELMGDVAPESGYRKESERQSLRPAEERRTLLDLARKVVTLAGDAASRIRQDNFRSEALALVAQSEAGSSSQIARFIQRKRDARQGDDPLLQSYPDEMTQAASGWALLIPIPIWRNRTLVEIVDSAANSNQFQRGISIARQVAQAQARADALVRVAEAQARAGLESEATDTYQEAIVAVMAIPQPAPRQIIGGVLLDSLISVGRFEDARAACVLISDPGLRLRALSAVARGMGERGLQESAERWIATEVNPTFRDVLRRSVIDGTKIYIRNGRQLDPSKDMGGPRANDILSPEELDRLESRPTR